MWYLFIYLFNCYEYRTRYDEDDDDEIAYFTVRWKTRASFVYRTKNIDNNDKDSKSYTPIYTHI